MWSSTDSFYCEKEPPVKPGDFHIIATQVYKPGSVLTAIYLVPRSLTGSSRLLEAVGQTLCFSTALLRIEFTAPQCSHGASALLPHFFTLTATRQIASSAVSLCCTCPGVTPGRHYLLSLPCGARTFLTCSLWACSRGCPTWLLNYCNLQNADCQISCKFLPERIYYKKAIDN